MLTQEWIQKHNRRFGYFPDQLPNLTFANLSYATPVKPFVDIGSLPLNLKTEILKHCKLSDALALSLTSKAWNQAVQQPCVWRQLTSVTFDSSIQQSIAKTAELATQFPNELQVCIEKKLFIQSSLQSCCICKTFQDEFVICPILHKSICEECRARLSGNLQAKYSLLSEQQLLEKVEGNVELVATFGDTFQKFRWREDQPFYVYNFQTERLMEAFYATKLEEMQQRKVLILRNLHRLPLLGVRQLELLYQFEPAEWVHLSKFNLKYRRLERLDKLADKQPQEEILLGYLIFGHERFETLIGMAGGTAD